MKTTAGATPLEVIASWNAERPAVRCIALRARNVLICNGAPGGADGPETNRCSSCDPTGMKHSQLTSIGFCANSVDALTSIVA